MNEALAKANGTAWAKLEKQMTCEHKHVLGPTRWTNTSMCMECGKEFATCSQASGEGVK